MKALVEGEGEDGEYFAEGTGFLGTQSPEPQSTNMRHYTELKDLIAPASSMSF